MKTVTINNETFTKDQRVIHDIFGEGTIRSIRDHGKCSVGPGEDPIISHDIRIAIDFDDNGEKELLAAFCTHNRRLRPLY